MKNEGEVETRERLDTTLPKEYIGWLDKHVEARIYFSRSYVIEVLILEAMKSEKKE